MTSLERQHQARILGLKCQALAATIKRQRDLHLKYGDNATKHTLKVLRAQLAMNKSRLSALEVR